MSRKSVIKTVSIPVELQGFLDENPDLKLSSICQSKIIEIRENKRMNSGEIERLHKAILMLNNKLATAGNEIENLKKKIKSLEERIRILEKK